MGIIENDFEKGEEQGNLDAINVISQAACQALHLMRQAFPS